MSDPAAPPLEHTLDELIAAATREAKLRGRVYPSFIKRGKIQPDVAEREQSRMDAIVRLLRWLRETGAPISGSGIR
jgi:hypothetical protein